MEGKVMYKFVMLRLEVLQILQCPTLLHKESVNIHIAVDCGADLLALDKWRGSLYIMAGQTNRDDDISGVNDLLLVENVLTRPLL